MVPLPDSSWEFDDTVLVFSTNVTLEAFSVRRLPGSRTVRDLMITSGKCLFQRLHRTAPAPYPRLFSSNVLKLDGFFGVLFSCSLCRLALLFCSVCFLLFHGHTHVPIACSGVAAVAFTVTIPLAITFLVAVTTSITASISVVAVSGTACLPAPVAVGHDCRSLCCGFLFRHPEYDPDQSRGESVSSLSAFPSTT